jgi:hypothetical protein
MKFVILIHSTPQPWGHPTCDYIAEHHALPERVKAQRAAEFDAILTEMSANGELVTAEALADPVTSTLFRWDGAKPIASDGPYAETKEQFAGFFMIDVASRDRAIEIAEHFAGPGETIELRPAMWPGGAEQ